MGRIVCIYGSGFIVGSCAFCVCVWLLVGLGGVSDEGGFNN